MFATGGLCVVLVCEMDRRCRQRRTAFLLRCVYGALIITAVEFSVGCIVNLWLQWDIWDYSRLPLNLLYRRLDVPFRPCDGGRGIGPAGLGRFPALQARPLPGVKKAPESSFEGLSGTL